MALAYAKLKIEIREISLRNRPESLYEASSKGTVPVLITPNNIVIDESLDIILWALKNSSNQTGLAWIATIDQQINKTPLQIIDELICLGI